MKGLIRFCVGRPVMMIMIMGTILLAGGFSLSVLPLDRLPEISYPRVTVETVYPGMGARDVRSIITIPVEDALSSVKGLQRLRSVSRDGASVVVLDFRWGVDPGSASVLVREAIDAVYPNLPEGIRKPVVVPGDPGEEPHAVIAVNSRSGDGAFARNLAEYELRARFRRIDGVGTVVLVGGESPEARIRVDIPRSLPQGMGPGEIARALASETVDIPGGNAREGDRELVVVSSGRPESLEELSRLILPAATGPLRLSDVAELSRDSARRKSLFIFDGREQTALEIYRRPGADPVGLSSDIRKTLDELIPAFSRDAEITLVYDSSPMILQSAGDLALSALLGTAAVIGTLFFFIRRIRYSLLAALAIPLSAASALTALALAGKSLNSMSLGGLALGIGLVSDTAVIVLDLLHRTFRSRKTRPLPEEAGDCVVSLSGSSLAGTLTTAVVFIPIIFLPGSLGALFGDMSVSLVTSIAAGWFYAQFILPALYRVLYKPASGVPLPKLEENYRGALRLALRRPVPMLVLTSALSLLGIGILAGRPARFVSPGQASEIVVTLNFPPGTDLEAAGRDGMAVSRILTDLPWISLVFGRAGAEDEDVGRRADTDYRKEELRLRCLLRKGAEPDTALAGIRRVLAKQPGPESSAAYPQDRTERLLGLSSSRTWVIRGHDREETLRRAGEAAEKLSALAGPSLASCILRPSGTRPELRVFPDREAAALLGVSSAQMAEVLYAATEGLVASRLEINGRPLEVRVAGDLRAPYPRPESMLEAIPLTAGQGGPVFLGAAARVERGEAEAALARLDRSDVLYLDILPAPGGEAGLSRAMEDLARRIPGLSRADESAFTRYRSSLLVTVFLVLALLYMTMGAQFESFALPGILMLTIPFSLAGAGPALLFSGAGLDSGSVLGLVVLFGLVVNNGIVLYEISAEKVSLGFPAAKAVYAGAGERLRPVLVTTLTTLFVLFPLIVSPLGASQRSMAAAMLGGSAASTLLTLFALPPVFVRFLGKRR
ncbi:MAG: efflux RND transporter permease subunit [Spirochaetaceae bacterium]|jgi:multidrug efflux pump subunit AcrB|nr:efflux RND transporter permease subunit [Spirochaetaceae bacterium]